MPNKSNRKTGSRRRSNRRGATGSFSRISGYTLLALLLIGVIYFISAAKSNSKHERRALPGDLTTVITNPSLPEDLIHYEGMTVSFNPETHQPNWVAWELTRQETDGSTTRDKFDFVPDPAVDGCATTDDYRRSGYDRGHMAPAGDMKWSREAMQQSFFTTNICPQSGDLNRGSWKKLEEKCRQRANADSAVIIVCGPIFKADEAIQRIGQTGVAVPRQFFKVILSPFTAPPTAIGFIMPNGAVPGGMQSHAVSVDEVEAITGHDFFAELPDEIENQVEATFNFDKFSRIRRK